MLAAFNAEFDRAESFRQHELGSGPFHANIAPKPMVPALRHRRGLSLDQGIAISRQKLTAASRYEQYEPPQWQDLAPSFAEQGSLRRPSTPTFNTELDAQPSTPLTTPRWKQPRPPRVCKTAQSSPVKQYAAMSRGPVAMDQIPPFQGISSNFLSRGILASLSHTNSLQASHDFDLQPPRESDDVFSEFTFHPRDNFDSVTVSSPMTPTMPSYLSLSAAVNGENTAVKTTEKPAKVPISPVRPLHSQATTASSRSSSPTKTILSPRALSIADLHLDESIDASIENTGITLDDIAEHIEGPDPIDNKWVCTFEGCKKRFGRKENIKSHVQTHLGDRQFKCNHCNKCFVRGHDLKRHSKIHTGVKPYPCECGNSFARHDALTRHKQRGMCSGAFASAMRKPVRRGRPKKRPDAEERRQKASKTRERSRKGHARTLSDSSCASFTSYASSASEFVDSASVREPSPVKDVPFLNKDFGISPEVFSFTPPASPTHSIGNIPSPTHSYHSLALDPELNPLYLSPSKRPLDDIPEEIPDLPLLAPPSPSVKQEVDITSPIKTFWPAEATLRVKTERPLIGDVFSMPTSEMVLNQDQIPGLDSSLTDISEPSSSQYEDDYFLSQGGPGPDLLNAHLFPVSFSPETEAFFDRFTVKAEVDGQ